MVFLLCCKNNANKADPRSHEVAFGKDGEKEEAEKTVSRSLSAFRKPPTRRGTARAGKRGIMKRMTMKKKNALIVNKDYKNLLHELKSIVDKGLHSAYKAVDNLKVQTYWQIGERIIREELKHKRADYGLHLIKNLSADLKIDKRLLYDTMLFYKAFPIVNMLCSQLSWSHFRYLSKVEDEKEKLFYQNKIAQNSWSVEKLREEIKNNLYIKTSTEEIEKVLRKELPLAQTPELFKDTYDFTFVDDKFTKKEKDLEDQLIMKIEPFLNELGSDISFVGRQVPITIDSKTHFIDLVLYNRSIPCVILIDLKIHKIDARDIGQMNKYVGYYRHNRQYAFEKDTIGLLICKDAGKEEMRYALDGLEKSIFVAKYKTKLPSESKIKKAVKKL